MILIELIMVFCLFMCFKLLLRLVLSLGWHLDEFFLFRLA